MIRAYILTARQAQAMTSYASCTRDMPPEDRARVASAVLESLSDQTMVPVTLFEAWYEDTPVANKDKIASTWFYAARRERRVALTRRIAERHLAATKTPDASFYVQWGRRLGDAGLYDLKLPLLIQGAKRHPSSWRITKALLDLLMDLDQEHEIDAVIRTYLRHHPSDHHALLRVGQWWKGPETLRIKHLKRAIREAPPEHRTETRLYLATVQMRAHPQDALKTLQRAERDLVKKRGRPAPAELWLGLARGYAKLGENKPTRRAFQAYQRRRTLTAQEVQRLERALGLTP